MAGCMHAVVRAACCALTMLVPQWGSAQSFPSQPIKIIAPVPPGGGVDILSRALAQKLTESFGVPVLVENKAGASAVVGTDFVAKSAPDGYTLLMGYSVLATNRFLQKSLPYDLDRDLTPVINVGYIPLILVEPPSFPPNSVKELIALAKSKPGQLAFASGGAGAGAHLSGELFKHQAGVDLVHVPYKGNAPALNDLLGGHVQIMFDTITTVAAAREGRPVEGARHHRRQALAAGAGHSDDDRGRTAELRDQRLVHDGRAEENAEGRDRQAQYRAQYGDLRSRGASSGCRRRA